jgi:hypothetical protein
MNIAAKAKQIADESAARHKATARKRGRNPKYPYVPIIEYTNDVGTVQEHQLRAVAFVTRAEAVAHAQRQIEADRARFEGLLLESSGRGRSNRRFHGLPEDIEQSAS